MSVAVSVVVVSRDRPDALYLCVLGLSQLQYSDFEIVVVADAKGLAAIEIFREQVKIVQFDEANISAARNMGISQSAGKIVAFIDDDAVPEPTWLTYLMAPFATKDVGAVGGFVLGRNGISFQWKARVIGPDGFTFSVDVDEIKATILTPPLGYAVKTEGTNMAVRRNVLIDLGGFDPAYHFYLDETDLNVRLAASNYRTAIAPLAQVHHGFAQSIRRRGDRVPSDLFDIGASWAVFQKKFVSEADRKTHWTSIVRTERKRLIEFLLSGGLEPGAVKKLMTRLKDGYQAGQSRKCMVYYVTKLIPPPFKPFPFKLRSNVFISGRSLAANDLQLMACDQVRNGRIVTLLTLSPTAFFHSVQFYRDGYWKQTGGLFGKSNRGQSVFKIWSKQRRSVFEEKRTASVRKQS